MVNDPPEFPFAARLATVRFPRSFRLFLDGVEPSCGTGRIACKSVGVVTEERNRRHLVSSFFFNVLRSTIYSRNKCIPGRYVPGFVFASEASAANEHGRLQYRACLNWACLITFQLGEAGASHNPTENLRFCFFVSCLPLI